MLEIGKQGAHILDVFALKEFDSEPEQIAKVYLESDLVTSTFGDTRMFFEHMDTKRDFKYLSSASRNHLK